MTVFDPITQNAIVNVPKSRIYGAELQADAQMGQLSINTGLAYNDSRINEQLSLTDSRDPLAGPEDVTGRQLAYAPRWTADMGVTYVVPAAFGKFSGTVQYSYTSRAYASVFEVNPLDVLASHSLVNLNAGLTLKNGLRIEAYGSNVGNVVYAAGTLGIGSAIWGPPRQYGARLRYSF